MEHKNMRVPELKALTRDRGLRNYSRMRKAELVALLHEAGAKALQNNGTPEGPRAPAPCTRSPLPSPQRHAVYVTLKFDDNRCCRIHSISDDGNGWTVTNKSMWLCPGRWLPGMAKIWGCWVHPAQRCPAPASVRP